MFIVYLKVYYRPKTDIVVAFTTGYAKKKFKVKKALNGIRVDNIFVPASSEIEFENNFKGNIIGGSEECRFCSGNTDHFSKIYHLSSLPDEQSAYRYLYTLKSRLQTSALLLR
jgi:hypothetical protein